MPVDMTITTDTIETDPSTLDAVDKALFNNTSSKSSYSLISSNERIFPLIDILSSSFNTKAFLSKRIFLYNSFLYTKSNSSKLDVVNKVLSGLK